MLDGCTAPDCGNKVLAKGLCGKHYQRAAAEKSKTNLCGCGCGGKTSYTFVHGHHTRLFTQEEQTRRGRMNNGDTQRAMGDANSTHYRKVGGRHEHRIVAEKKYGRELTYDDVVHHVDGDKRNNHPNNLVVMTRAEHIAEHRNDMVKGLRNARKN